MEAQSVCACGYSFSSLLALVSALMIGLCLTALLTFGKTPVKIPWGANSSLVLSAACHPPPGDTNAHFKELKWGVVKSRYCEVGIGHCSLTSEDVTAPEEGNQYA